MKSCEEMVSSLLVRRDEYAAAQKRRCRAAVRAALVLCAVCLASVGGISMRRGGTIDLPEPPPVTEAAGTAALRETVVPTTTPPSPTVEDQLLHWVEAEEFPLPVKALFALHGRDFAAMEEEALCAYYGVNIFPTVPEDMILREHAWGIFRRGGGSGEVAAAAGNSVSMFQPAPSASSPGALSSQLLCFSSH